MVDLPRVHVGEEPDERRRHGSRPFHAVRRPCPRFLINLALVFTFYLPPRGGYEARVGSRPPGLKHRRVVSIHGIHSAVRVRLRLRHLEQRPLLQLFVRVKVRRRWIALAVPHHQVRVHPVPRLYDDHPAEDVRLRTLRVPDRRGHGVIHQDVALLVVALEAPGEHSAVHDPDPKLPSHHATYLRDGGVLPLLLLIFRLGWPIRRSLQGRIISLPRGASLLRRVG